MKALFLSIVLTISILGCKSNTDSISTAASKTSNVPLPTNDISLQYDTVGRKATYPSFKETAYIHPELDIKKGVYFGNNGDDWLIMNIYGDTISYLRYERIATTSTMVMLQVEGIQYYYNKDLVFIDSTCYNEVITLSTNYFMVKDKGKYNIMRSPDSVIGATWYDLITIPESEAYYLGKSSDQWSILSLKELTIMEKNYAEAALHTIGRGEILLKRIGPITIGMTIEALKEAYPSLELTTLINEPTCKILSFGPHFLSLRFLFERRSGQEQLERIYINGQGIHTRSGIGIGSTKREVITTYKEKIKEEVHHYDENGKYLYYTPADIADNNYRINFNYDGSRISFYSIGRIPAIYYGEGCF